MPYTGSPPTFSLGEKTGIAAKLNQLRDAIRGFTDPWTSYTPTIAGWTLGNGAQGGKYARTGKLVTMRAVITVGSTTAIGSSLRISLPAAFADGAYLQSTALAMFEDVGSGWYQGGALLDAGTGDLLVRRAGTSGLLDNLSSTSPFTWATGDRVMVSAVYEAA